MERQTMMLAPARKRERKGDQSLPIRRALSSLASQYVMALTELSLVLFVLVHMAGNLLILAGRDAFNAYARSLEEYSGLLWLARTLLLIAFVVHILKGVA